VFSVIAYTVSRQTRENRHPDGSWRRTCGRCADGSSAGLQLLGMGRGRGALGELWRDARDRQPAIGVLRAIR